MDRFVTRHVQHGIAAAVLAALLPLSAAEAAPQALAVVASNGPVPLSCSGDACIADFSSYCLQQDRDAPGWGTAYYLADAERVSVVGRTRDGREIALPAKQLLTITAVRRHKMVRMSIPRSTLRELGLESVAIEVGELATALPTAIPGDPEPQTELDIALATGPLRSIGKKLVDSDADRAGAARLTTRLVNGLPLHGRASAELRDKVWGERVTEADVAGLSPEALERVQNGYAFCNRLASDQNPYTGQRYMPMRRCLSAIHDRFIDDLNQRYWDAVKTGS